MALVYARDRYQSIEVRTDDCRPYGQGVYGYGRKIATQYLVRFDNEKRWRRVYVCQLSNAGTAYVLVKGQWIVLLDGDLRKD